MGKLRVEVLKLGFIRIQRVTVLQDLRIEVQKFTVKLFKSNDPSKWLESSDPRVK